jgi:alpha-galactosidase
MTNTLSAGDTPWVPGVSRDRPTVPVELPGGVPAGLRAHLVTAGGAAARPHARAALDPGDGTLRVTVDGSGAGRVAAVFLVPAADAVALWLPGSSRGQSALPPSWADDIAASPFGGAALGCLVGRADRPIVTFGAHGGDGHVRMRAGIVEETADLLVAFEADLEPGPLEIVLDLTAGRFETAVARTGRALGLCREPVADAEYTPVLCTWYSFHQALDTERLLAEAETAAALGFGTVIVDDGWQTADTDRGYGSCGDWRVEPAKIPDPAGLVRSLAELGLRTLWWVGTPFLGHRSAAYAAGGIPTLHDERHMEAAVLDPRSRRARDHLTSRLAHLVESTGAAGLKLDFLERFAVENPPPPPADAVGTSVTGAALSLLDEIHAALSRSLPAPAVEFREPYVSAETVRRATMLRVADCPLSPATNRVGVIDLRLTTHGAAVHSDPIMWAAADSPERVAQHLHSSLFAVPQVSVALHRQSARQLATLRAWMRLWTEHREVLLHGRLRVTGIAGGYAAVEARRGTVALTAQYAPAICDAPPGVNHWTVVNAHDHEVLLRLSHPRTARYRITDCTGETVHTAEATLNGVCAFPVPTGGTLHVTFPG